MPLTMRCPRCQSSRIQRGYRDAPIPLRAVGLHVLLCNRCGLEFKGFDPLGRIEREPSVARESFRNRRRVPRYQAHLPATISLVEGNARLGKLSYTQSSRGHCESISHFGMTLSFVGTRFTVEELSRKDCLLLVTVHLPSGPVEAVVCVVRLDRPSTEGAKAKWVVGATIYQMSEDDTARLEAYLNKRSEEQPFVTTE